MTVNSLFRCKQFEIKQSKCGMKVGTDGMLLGALVDANNPSRVLDIGTGTGIIALMCAQKFQYAFIDAIEIDLNATEQAIRNFKASPFNWRLQAYHVDLLMFNSQYQYDLIVSNPPFFVNALKNANPDASIARHTEYNFFIQFFQKTFLWLAPTGTLWLILPVELAIQLKKEAQSQGFFLKNEINIRHNQQKPIKRTILALCKYKTTADQQEIYIKNMDDSYSTVYQNLMRDFLLIF